MAKTPLTAPEVETSEEVDPFYMYGPGHQAKIFTRQSDVPEGWQDHPSKVEETVADL